MQHHFPKSFEYTEDNTMKVVYTGEATDPEPYFNATSIEEFLGSTNPSATASNRLETILKKIENYKAQFGDSVPSGDVKLIGSSKPARILASDGVYTVLAVKSSTRLAARDTYYYNKALLFFIINTARTDKANALQHWINGEILPSIAKYGEYVAVRKDGIGIRRFLTDAIKRQIDLKRMDEHAYPTITDVVYIIRYGMNSNQLRKHLGLEEGDNIREHLSQEELQALARIEDELAGLLNFGLKPEQVMTNKEFLSVHRKPL